MAKLRDQTVKKLKQLEESRTETESERDTLKTGALHQLLAGGALLGISMYVRHLPYHPG